jgi:hypothetical protein
VGQRQLARAGHFEPVHQRADLAERQWRRQDAGRLEAGTAVKLEGRFGSTVSVRPRGAAMRGRWRAFGAAIQAQHVDVVTLRQHLPSDPTGQALDQVDELRATLHPFDHERGRERAPGELHHHPQLVRLGGERAPSKRQAVPGSERLGAPPGSPDAVPALLHPRLASPTIEAQLRHLGGEAPRDPGCDAEAHRHEPRRVPARLAHPRPGQRDEHGRDRQDAGQHAPTDVPEPGRGRAQHQPPAVGVILVDVEHARPPLSVKGGGRGKHALARDAPQSGSETVAAARSTAV